LAFLSVDFNGGLIGVGDGIGDGLTPTVDWSSFSAVEGME
jgi:hypothetical protein